MAMMYSLLFEGIGVQNWTYILVGITFSVYIGIAIWSRASSTKEFYVAGGGVSPLANGMATSCRLDECCFFYFYGWHYIFCRV